MYSEAAFNNILIVQILQIKAYEMIIIIVLKSTSLFKFTNQKERTTHKNFYTTSFHVRVEIMCGNTRNWCT